MFIKKLMKLVFIAVVLIVFTGCGGSGGNAAIDKLIAYATSTPLDAPVPTAADYAAAGVVGVTDDNVDLANDIILGLAKELVDTAEEVQALTGTGTSPIAVIIVSRNFANKGGNIDFNGLNSTDLDGVILTYVWTLNGGVLSSEATFSKADLPYGTHTITLTVTDDEGNTGQATVQVRIEDINNAPVANAGPDQIINLSSHIVSARFVAYALRASSNVHSTVKLNGILSGDDGVGDSTLTYKWEFIGGNGDIIFSDPNIIAPSFEVFCSNIGDIIIQLTVSDGTHTTIDTVKITVIDRNGVCGASMMPA